MSANSATVVAGVLSSGIGDAAVMRAVHRVSAACGWSVTVLHPGELQAAHEEQLDFLVIDVETVELTRDLVAPSPAGAPRVLLVPERLLHELEGYPLQSDTIIATIARTEIATQLEIACRAVLTGLCVTVPPSRTRMRDTHARFTEAEQLVYQELRRGRTNLQIAERLGISVNTVKYHLGNIFTALGVHTRTEAVVKGATVLAAGAARYRDVQRAETARKPGSSFR